MYNFYRWWYYYSTRFFLNQCSKEIQFAIKQMSSGNAGRLLELLKWNIKTKLIEKLLNLFNSIWKVGHVPQDFNDAFYQASLEKNPTKIRHFSCLYCTEDLGLSCSVGIKNYTYLLLIWPRTSTRWTETLFESSSRNSAFLTNCFMSSFHPGMKDNMHTNLWLFGHDEKQLMHVNLWLYWHIR